MVLFCCLNDTVIFVKLKVSLHIAALHSPKSKNQPGIHLEVVISSRAVLKRASLFQIQAKVLTSDL